MSGSWEVTGRPVHPGHNMLNFTAKVTSDLQRFPQGTTAVLDFNKKSVIKAKFGKCGRAWLACGSQLVYTSTETLERISAYCFSSVAFNSPTVVAVKDFPWQKRTGLLVALVEEEGSVLCLYDVGLSKVVKAVVLPGSVTAIEPIVNHGGASVNTQHLHQSLRCFFGVAAAVTDVGHVILIDMCLDDLSSSQDELDPSDLEVISGISPEIPKLREAATRERRHLGLELLVPSGTCVSTLHYVKRTNQLVVGFSDGYLSLWNMKTLRREYHAQIEGGCIPVIAVSFQEPEDDPRNCCYLWAVQNLESGQGVSLHLLQMAFGDKKCLPSGEAIYENLEYCEERYSLDLSANALSLRGQIQSIKLLSCQAIETFHGSREKEDGFHDGTSPDISICIFSWQVNTYGQPKPSIYIGVFDINRWYQAQMPDSLRPGQFLRNCSYFAFWSLDALVNLTTDSIFDILVNKSSLSRGPPPSYPPPEQFYLPSNYSFDAVCLLSSGVIQITCNGFQRQALTFLKNTNLNDNVHDCYNRCLAAGLLSPTPTDVNSSRLSQEEQLQAVLSAAVETSSLSLLSTNIKQWTAEIGPRSDANLRFLLEWTWNKVVHTKNKFDQLCVPLFDGSCAFIDPQILNSLHHCELLLANLSTIINCFLTEAQEFPNQGLINLTNKQLVTRLLIDYVSIVLWLCHCGLLPDNSGLQLTRPYYDYNLMQHYYTERRRKMAQSSSGKWNSISLMIDHLISEFGEKLEHLWRRDEGGTGKYPPPTLHALLDLYLLEDANEVRKHASMLYYLLDIIYSIPNKPEFPIEAFPAAFYVPFGLVKLIQGFWLLDHNDYQNAVECLLHPEAGPLKPWQHTPIIEILMCQGYHVLALRYLRIIRPPIETIKEAKLHMTVLMVNNHISDVWNMQRLLRSRLNQEELLKHVYETCLESGTLGNLLNFSFTKSEQGYLQKFLYTNGRVQNRELYHIHHLLIGNDESPTLLNYSLKGYRMDNVDCRLQRNSVNTNSILDHYYKLLPKVQRSVIDERRSYLSIERKDVTKPQPLTTVINMHPKEYTMPEEHFIRNVVQKIEEVAAPRKEESEVSSPKSVTHENQQHTESPLPKLVVQSALVPMPISKSKRLSRFLDPILIREPKSLADQQTPHNSSVSLTSSPIHLNLMKLEQLKKSGRASEFNLLETPPVVRKAKALVISTDSAAHTPLSIMRSSVSTTPLGSPSLSPGRSLTPPLQPKGTKISFMEQIYDKFVKAKLTPVKDLLKASPLLNSECLSQVDISKDESNVSVRSDQTTLEYTDAPTPEDMEDDVVAVTTETQSLVNEEEAHFERDILIDDYEQPIQEFLDLEERDNEEGNSECFCLPENGSGVLHQLTPVQKIDLPTESILEPVQGNSKYETEQELVSSTKDSVSVISIHDSEMGMENIHSEHLKDMEVNGDIEVQIVEENVLQVEDVPGAPSVSVAVQVLEIEKEMEVDIEMPEPKPIMRQQMYLNTEDELHRSVENIEHHYKCELDNKDSVEREADDGEHAVASNFSLMLESDAVETEPLKQDHDVKAVEIEPITHNHDKVVEIELLTQDHDVKAVEIEPLTHDPHDEEPSTVADKNVYFVNPVNIDECSANTFSGVDHEQETKIFETLPYVSEPIKVAMAENILDVFKDTLIKDFTAEVNSDSVYENEYVKKLQNAHTASVSSSMVTPSSYEVIQPKTPEKCNEKKVDELNKLQASQSLGSTALLQPPTPRRSIRMATKLPDSSIAESEVPTTPRRGGRKAKENTAASSILQEKQLSVGIARISRMTRGSVSETLESTEVKMPVVQEIQAANLPSSPARTRRGKATALDDQINRQEDFDETVAMPVTPSRITRSSKLVNQLEKETPTRGRRRKSAVNELVKHFEHNAAQASNKPALSPTNSPRKVPLKWSRIKSESQIDVKSCEPLENVKVQEQLLDTPRQRPKRSTIIKTNPLESTDIPEKTLPIVELLDNTKTMTKKTSKTVGQTRTSVLPPLLEGGAEEMLPLPDSHDQLSSFATEEKNRSIRLTRTRASSASTFMDPSDVPFQFSDPTPRRGRKAKAEKIAPPISPPVEMQLSAATQYVFSPPSLRTRSTRNSANITIKEKVNSAQKADHEADTEEPVPKKRGRPSKHDAKKHKKGADMVGFSPPPIEIQLLSPPQSPNDHSESVKSSPSDSKAAPNPIRKTTRKRIVTSKPVTRRKIR